MSEETVPITLGYWLSSEEHGPQRLVALAAQAEAAGFSHAMISDHLHPWVPAQGESPFVWGVLGAISQVTSTMQLATGVTAPMLRMRPAVVAHAAATAAVLLGERFELGVGSGEWLNEHVVGGEWPPPAARRAMLGEAIEVIRDLLSGSEVNHDGDHVTVRHTRLYTAPVVPPPILVAASGRRSTELAGRAGDGLITFDCQPRIVEATKTAAASWPNATVPPSLNGELARPQQFAEIAALSSPADVAASMPCGPDPAPVVRAVARFAAAGYTRVYLHQVGPDQEGFFEFAASEVRPALGLEAR
jgi:alkanesulfonate monooxygenase SsuD/methylene tetrahydromethanopterin reductase-like flavin-dependent oxidoreductase (luciferase family)